MNKLKQAKLETKLIAGGVTLLAVGNPLSLAYISYGAEVAMMWLNGVIQLAFVYAVSYSWVFMAISATLIVLGAGVKMGSDNKKSAKKIKEAKGGTNGMAYKV